ncbi:MAG: pyridoxal-phosphate dependent enzyme, partial [Desulforhopalus sp.]
MAQTLLQSAGNTPLLTLNNFGEGTGAIILGKQESRNPAGSVKCRIAVSMVEAAERQGLVTPKTTIIEPTSGNTGIGLAFVCAHKKLRLILTMP